MMSSKTKTTATKEEAKPALVPKLRFPEFRGAEGWTTKTLGAVASISTEKVGDNTCIPMSITSGVGLVSQMEKFGRIIAGSSYKNYLLLKKNDFAYNKSATKEYPEGFIALYSGDELAAVPNSIFTCFRIKGDSPEPLYLNYLLLGNLHGKWLRNFIEVGARAHGSLSIDEDDLLALPVPLPIGKTSLREQQKIAECLSSVDELIAAQARKLDALKTHKKGLMQQLFPREGETQPRLRFPEFRDAGAWEPRNLDGVLLAISSGLSLTQGDDKTGHKVTRIETISAGTIDLAKVGFVKSTQDVSDYKLEVGDILFSNINSLAHIGKSVFVDRDYDLYHGMNLLRLVVNRIKGDPKFVFYLINTRGIRDSLRERANKAVNQASINQTELGKTELALPSILEQQRIASCLTSLDDLIAAQTQKLEALKTHKQGLMQQLFPSLEEEL
jgi:type I restriction enzyme S subunit